MAVRPSSDPGVSMEMGCSRDSVAPELSGKDMRIDTVPVRFILRGSEGHLGQSPASLLPMMGSLLHCHLILGFSNVC